MKNTSIGWCDDTVNVVEGCSQVDLDCDNCYAMGIAARFSQPHKDGAQGHYHGLARYSEKRHLPQWTGVVRLFSDRLDAMFWRLLFAPTPRRQFLCSEGDIFHREVPDAFLDEVFARIAILEMMRSWNRHDRPIEFQEPRPLHPIYMLTKRPERAAEYTNDPDVEDRVATSAHDFLVDTMKRGDRRKVAALAAYRQEHIPRWPLRSVALITSAGTQAGAEARIPHLLRCKAAIRGVSCEPMTGPVDFRRWLSVPEPIPDDPHATHLLREAIAEGRGDGPRMISWMILGGESGAGGRPCELAWMDDVAEQCAAAGVALFCKQLGTHLARRLGRPGKGGKLEDLPERLRIRQFPRIPA